MMTQIQSGVYQSGWIPTGSSVELSVRDRHICSTDTTSLQHECVYYGYRRFGFDTDNIVCGWNSASAVRWKHRDERRKMT
ncbi:MAG: hypothetical protein IPQ10_10655 [Saprospiraceae bacterium]|nr:hypothetical protein [Saprospiraceae bacterium]